MVDMNEFEKKLLEIESRLKLLEESCIKGLQQSNSTSPKKISLKEFILEKKPSGDVEKTLTIAAYLERYCDKTIINSEDIKNGFKESKELIPKNISDQIAKNISKGHLKEVSEKKNGLKAYSVTSTGDKAIDSSFKIKSDINGQNI